MKAISKLKIFFIIVASSFVLLLLAFYYYKSESEAIIKDKYEFLNAVANLKLDEVIKWREQRLSDAKYFPTIGKFIKYTSFLNEDKNNSEAKKYFSNALMQFKVKGYWENVLITDTTGKILFDLDSDFTTVDKSQLEEIKNAIKNGSIVFGDFYHSKNDEIVYLNIISTIKDNSGIPIGSLVQQVDPNKADLFSLIQKWPTTSKTAETLLFKKLEDHVVFLNELRHKKNTPLSFKISLSQKEIVAVKGVFGARGIIEGKDYRGVDVLADLQSVPGTDWFMVTKVDKDELYSELFYKADVIVIILLISILLIALTALYIYKLQQSSTYKKLFLKQKELAETQEEYKTALYSIGDGVITTDTKGNIKQMNFVAENITGWKENEVKGKNLGQVFKVINEYTGKPVENPVDRVLKEGAIVGLANHTMLISKNGTKIPIADSGSPIRNDEKKTIGVVLVFRDQTEEREKEKVLVESEEKFRKMTLNSPLGMHFYELKANNDLILIDSNPAADKILGIKHSLLLGKNIEQAFPSLADTEIPQKYREAASKGIVWTKEQITYKDDKIEGAFEVQAYQTKPNFMVTLFSDITLRKRAEEELKASEEKFTKAFLTSPDSININRLSDGMYVSVNNGFTNLTGYTEKDVIGKTSLEINIWADIKDRNKLVAGLQEYGVVENLEARFRLKNGEVKNGLISASIIELNSIKHIISITRDISDRKLAEEIIKNSEANLNSLINNRNESIWSIDKDYNLIVFNNFFSEAYYATYNKKLIKGLNVIEILTPELKAFWKPKYDTALSGEKLEFEFSAELDNGIRFFQVSLNPIISDRIISGVSALSVDITERKRMEEELAAREIELRNLADSSPGLMGTFYLRPDGSVCMPYTSPQIQDLFGLRSEDVVDDAAPLLARTHPDDAHRVNESIAESARTMTPWHCEYRVLHPNRGQLWLEGSTNPKPHPKGGIIWYGFVLDITERKLAEEEVRLSELNLRNSQRVAMVGHYDLDVAAGQWTCSEMLDSILGIEHLFSHSVEDWYNLLHPDDKEMMINHFLNDVLRDKKEFNKEYRIIRKNDKEVRWVHGLGNIEVDDNNISTRMFGTIQDVSERKRYENALIKSEERLRLSLIAANQGLYDLNVQTGEVIVNDEYALMLGYDPKTFNETNSFWIERLHPDDRDRAAKAYQDYIVGVTSEYKVEFRQRTKNNEWKWILSLGKIIEYDANSKPLRMLGTHTDINSRKIAEEELRESEIRFRTLAENSPVGIFRTDATGFTTYVSPRWCEISGLTFEEGIGDGWLNAVHPEDRNMLVEGWRKANLDKMASKSEYRYLHNDGSIAWVLGNAVPLKDNLGNAIGYIGTITDITEHKKAEAELHKLSRTVQQSPAAIIITDIKGDIEYVNPKFTEVTGYSFEEVRGHNPRILKSDTMSSSDYKKMWEDILSGKEWRGEFYNKKKNGEYYWESASISPIFNSKNEITNFLAIKQDITEQKRMTSELIEAKEKAEEMNRVKSYFYANMSHELRTPFVGIMGFSEMLSESLQNPAEKEMAEQILKSSKRLTDTLNKILNVTRLEFDKIDVKLSDVDIVELIQQLSVLFSKSASIKNTIIKTEFDPNVIRVKTDSKLLEETLTNLLNNAVKYTENGIIEISAKSIIEKDKDYLILKVSDTGVGIPKNKQEIIWQEFRQASEGMNRSFEGTGLGLTIIKKYINTLGGNIKLESEIGEGATFTIELPVINLGEKEINVLQEKLLIPPKISDIPKRKKPKILYVEDDTIALSYVEKVLRSLYEIDTAFSASIALDLAKKNNYEVMLLDINLGRGMDGIELLQLIRKIDGYSTIPIVAVTAYANESDRLEFLAKGFTHYLSKPFTSVELRATLSRIFN